MADEKPWESFSNTAQQPGSSDERPWESFGGKTQPEAKGFTGHARDLGLSLTKGAVAVPEIAVGAGDIITGGRTGQALERLGFRPKEAKQVLSDFATDKTKEQQRQFQDADGIIDKAGVALSNPSLITNAVAESAPSMLAGGVAGRAIKAASPASSAIVAGSLGEGAVMAGSQAEQIRQESSDGLLTPGQSAAAVGTGTLGSLFGYAGGQFARKLGIGDVDTMLTRGYSPVDVATDLAKTPAKSIPRQVVEGAITEGFLEELPQSVAEQVIQNLALDRPWSQGVDEAVVMGTLAGMAMGGPAAGISGLMRPSQQQADPLQPQAPADQAGAPETPPVAPAAPQMGGDPAFTPPPVDPSYRTETIGAGIQPAETVAPVADVVPAPATPSQSMGIDPNAGPMSAAAATAVDTGASQEIARQNVMQQAAETADKSAPKPEQQAMSFGSANVDPETGEIIQPTPEQQRADLTAQINYIRNQAKNGGWTSRLLTARQNIEAQLAKLNSPNTEIEATQTGVADAPQPIQSSPSALPAAVPQTPDADPVGSAWAGMSRQERQAVADKTDLSPVLRKNIAGADWQNLGVPAKTKLAAQMAPQPVNAPAIQEKQANKLKTGAKQNSALTDQQVADYASRTGEAPENVRFTANMLAATGQDVAAYFESSIADRPRRDAERAQRQADMAKRIGPDLAQKLADAPGISKPVKLTAVDAAANEAATSPQNDLPEPTQAQKEAGNYTKGHIKVGGLDITIENPRGSDRTGKRDDGSEWRHTMSDHYGYIKRTKGADGEQVDVYVGSQPESGQVFVVDQLDQRTGGFDEHKAMLGFSSEADAVAAYKSNFDENWKVGKVTAMTQDQFKQWLAEGDTTKPLAQDQIEQPLDMVPTSMSEPKNESKPTEPASKEPRGVPAKKAEAEKSRKGPDQLNESVNGFAMKRFREAESAGSYGGWRMVDDSLGDNGSVRLVSPGADRIATFKYDPKSGADHKRAQVRAISWAQENPIESVASTAELVAKPVSGGQETTVVPAEKTEKQPRGVLAKKAAADKAKAAEPAKAEASQPIRDFGEKIGGARKDKETSGTRRAAKSTDERPAWMRRYQVSQIVSSTRPDETGKWSIADTKKLDRFGQPKRMGSLFGTEQEAIDAIPLLAVAQKHRPIPTKVGDETRWEIWRTVSDYKRVKVVDQQFDTREAALEYMAKNAKAIIETNTTFGEADLPRPESTVRSGSVYRDGPAKDRDFMDTFGFRGVEFGNWNNQEERQQLLDDAFDGLMDLAEVMDIPPRAISLNGELALAFGARGQGLSGARAHYERNKAAINLTKMNGAGSLAHEWFHALDHYFGRQDGKASGEWVVDPKDGTRSLKASGDAESDYASGGLRRTNSGVRPEVREAYNDLMQTMFKKAEQYVEDTVKADNFVARSRKDVSDKIADIRRDLAEQKDPKYWKRNNKPASAEQLAEFDTVAQQIIDGAALETELRSTGSKSARSIMSGMRWTNDALDKMSEIFKAVRGRTGFNSDGKGEFDRLRGLMNGYSSRLKMLADAQAETTKAKMVPTDFAMNAKELDQGRGSDYWTTPHEMAARAFQGYVEDKIAGKGGRSPFLNYGPEGAVIPTPWGWKRPFPHGQERKVINKAFDKLIDTLETREGEGGNQILFSRSGKATKDKAYLEAVERGDMDTAQQMALEAARDAGYITGNDYRMMHQAPNRDTGNVLSTIKDSGLVPDDYWTKPEWYQGTSEERESFSNVSRVLRLRETAIAEGRPTHRIGLRVHRAIPKDVKDTKIRNGDWVTPSRAYAQMEGAGIVGGYKIITNWVPLDNLYWDGNSMAELGVDDGNDYAYKNTKNNRKLVDAVTRDGEGNVIPLSKRFNSRIDDVRYSFSGPTARTADMLSLASAQQQVNAGYDPERVRQETGWHRGNDGKWRFEISDNEAGLSVPGDNFASIRANAYLNRGDDAVTVGDVLKHDKLFAAYPHLSELPLNEIPAGENALAKFKVTTSGPVIEVAPRMKRDRVASALLHELQHAIQAREGFARGGHWKEHGADVYQRLAGEVEARNTQARMLMNDQFRQMVPPSETADVADRDVIVTFNGKDVVGAPVPQNLNVRPESVLTPQSLAKAFDVQFPSLSPAVRKMLKKGQAGQKGGVVFIDSADPIQIARVFSRKTGLRFSDSVQMLSGGGAIRGFYDSNSGLTFLIGPNLDAVTGPAVLLHEMVHSQQRKKIDDAALAMLMNRGQQKNPDLRSFLDRVAARMVAAGKAADAGESAAYIVEQAVQEGRSAGFQVADSRFLNWVDSTLGKKVGNIIRDFIKMVRQWMLRNGRSIKGDMMIDDLVQYAMAGVERAADGNVNTGPGEAVQESRDSITSTPAFKRWFGDSKVVDSQGNPLVVYHGTSDGGFSAFNSRSAKESDANQGAADDGLGFFFTDDLALAEQHRDRLDGARPSWMPAEKEVYAVYLSLKNPFVTSGNVTADQRAELDAQGYDGVIYDFGSWKEYVAFRPEQIKSATGNNGQFDPANPDIRFSRSGMKTLASKATAELNKTFNAPGKLSWWHKTIGTMYNLAERSPAFKPVFQAAQGFIDDVSHYATDAAELAPTLLPKLETWRDIAKKPIDAADNKAIAKPIFEGTLVWARDLEGNPVRVEDMEQRAAQLTTEQKAEILVAHDKIPPGLLKAWKALGEEVYAKNIDGRYQSQMLKPGVVWTDAELKSMFGLNDKQVGLYHEFREATNRSLDTMARADMIRFGGDDVKDLRDAVMDADDVHSAARLLRNKLAIMASEQPDRAAQLMATANGMIERAEDVTRLQSEGYAPLSRFGKYTVDVVVDGERQYFSLFESEREANDMAEKMRQEFGAENVTQGTLSDESYKLFAGMTPETAELYGNMLGLDSTGDSAKDKAFQDFIKLTKTNRSAMRRLIHRQGIAGFSEDVGRVLASFVYSNARQTAAGLHMGDLGEAINLIPKQQGELKDSAVRLSEYIKNPQEEAQAIRGLLFAQYLGGSVASAFVNMTQPFAVTFPWLSQYGGARKAAKQIGRAAANMSTKGYKYESDLAAALKMAEADGVVSPQEVHQLMGQARGSGSLQSGDGTRLGTAKATAANSLTRLSVAWGKLFGAAEQVNRRITYIASYRTAKEHGIENPDQFARDAVRETQFVYSKASKMQWGRGPVGATLMTFKTYSVAYLELMSRLWSQGEPGSQERKDGRKAAMLMVATLMLMGGAGGLPFAEDAEDLIDGAAQIMGYNFSAKKAKEQFLSDVFGPTAGRFIDKGLSGLPGAPLDVSGRLGMGNLIPGTGLLQERTDHTRDVLEIAGPAGDLANRFVSGARKIAGGDIKEGVLEMSPTAVRNAAKGADMAVTDMYRDTKGYKVLDTNTLEAALKAIGFQPNSVAQVQEANWINQRSKAYYSLRAQEIRAKWAAGIFERDPDMVQQARDEIADWNRKNPDQPMLIKINDIMRRVREMAKDKDQRIADTAPKAMRAQMRQDVYRLRSEME